MADGNDGDRAHPGHVYNAALQSASHRGEAGEWESRAAHGPNSPMTLGAIYIYIYYLVT